MDRLIRRTIQTGIRPPEGDIDAIIRHVASAPFTSQRVRMDPRYVQMAAAHGFHVPGEQDALTAHVAKHIWAQQQWSVTTSAAEYLDDLHAAAVTATSRLAVFERGRRTRAVVIGVTADIVPISRRGPKEGRYVVVVYAPERAMIVTGYMTMNVRGANVPAGATWLK